MKKLKIFAVLFFLICTMAAFAACGGKLDAPKGVSVTEEDEISWSPVKDAYRYLVQFTDVDSGEEKELKTKENKIGVFEFDLKEGWYDVRVKALSGEDEEKNSVWSSTLEYYKIYESGCSFTLVNNVEYHVTGSEKAAGEVVIESTYKGKPVTRIAEGAFRTNTRITSVTVGENIEVIERNAFSNCTLLEKVVLPEGLKSIGERAFYSCRELTEINIPDQVTLIDTFAFGYAKKLEKLTFGQSIRAIGDSAFFGCAVLEKVEIPDTVEYLGEKAFASCSAVKSVSIGKGITEIGARTFYENTELAEITFATGIQLDMIGDLAFAYATKVTEVEVPDGVTYLGAGAFAGCSQLYGITIPDTIEHIGENAFGGTKYYITQVDNTETNGGLYYLGKWLIGASVDDDDTDNVDTSFKGTVTAITPETFKAGTVGIADAVLERCPILKDVELPDSMLYIGNFAFNQCPILNLVTMRNVKTVGNYAFAEDANISQLSLGTKLESIGSYAFYKCGSLENNSLNPIVPSSVRHIGTFAFAESGLWDNPEDGLIYAGSWVVGFQAGIRDVTVKEGTVGISDYAFFMSTISSIGGIGESVKYIGRGAFAFCAGLGTITLCEDMERIEDYTFYACANLINVKMPPSLKTVGRSAFYDCQYLSNVDFSSVLEFETIGEFAFSGCLNLTEVDFGWTLKTIEANAFYKCYSLKAVELPHTVETIGDYAFYNNYISYTSGEGEEQELVRKGLTKISFDKDLSDGEDSKLKTIGNYAFTGCQLLESIVLPDSLVSLGTSAFYNCFEVTEVSLGANLETIGDYAFFGLNKVTSLELPETVKRIGMYAFKGWEGLTSVVIPSSVQIIDEHAFYGCKSATIYTDLTPDQVNWDIRWNSSYRPVIYGATLSDDKTHVVSLTITANTFSNLRADTVLVAPTRAADDEYTYVFEGWATSENGSVVYGADQIVDLPVGTTLYAKWNKIPKTVEPTK